MDKKISSLVIECKNLVELAKDINEIRAVRLKFMGKSGLFTELLKELKNVPKEDKPKFGSLINSGKNQAEQMIKEMEAKLQDELRLLKLEKESVDITMPAKYNKIGALHPLTKVKEEILDIFVGLGFNIAEGPEIETDYYNFQAMNIPTDHPARDMQDTFYIIENILLRTHTSPMQARVMEKSNPPIKVVVPGRVYRSDDDASHSPMFHQIEGLFVSENVTLSDLYNTLSLFFKAFFSEDTAIRFRPSYFPFTEPSVEVDVTCAKCNGKGCSLCKGSGWIEVLGSGIVNPKVLELSGIDSTKYSGFAFGIGVERITMIKYGIPDIRILFDNDIRFLEQYR